MIFFACVAFMWVESRCSSQSKSISADCTRWQIGNCCVWKTKSSEYIMAANGPPSLLIIKKETESEASMFNLLLCKLFEGWLYGNCSLVLYIYRCTLCQGQGNCVGSILSFHGSISEAICEAGQIKLVLTSSCDGAGLQVPPQRHLFYPLRDAL